MPTIATHARIYYRLRPLIPRRVQVWLRGLAARRKRRGGTLDWPILERAGRTPDGWPGWPGGRKFALVLLHDVETALGQSRALELMRLEQARGFVSCFNFVPERYHVSAEVRRMLGENGFEVGVHGLLHDGRLFESRSIFLERAQRINAYLHDWRAVGFCSPSSHHYLDWMHDLDIEYDSSTFDTDPFEPQPDGQETIFPFWVPPRTQGKPGGGIVELPYTLPQDYTLFVLLREATSQIWQRKLRWIAERGGMALLIAHPDYMNIGGYRRRFQEYPVETYLEFLEHVQGEYGGQYWNALPHSVAAYVRAHSQATPRQAREAEDVFLSPTGAAGKPRQRSDVPIGVDHP